MAKTLEFGGMSTVVVRSKPLKKVFNIIDYDTESWYITKKDYHHEEEGLTFDYKYVVRTADLYELSGDDADKGKVAIDLFIIVDGKSMCKESRDKIRLGCGADYNEKISPMDVVAYGLGVPFADEVLSRCRSLDGTKVRNKLKAIATMIDTMDSFRGFYLDKAWNRIGTQGWDVIRELVHGEDYIQATLARYA